MKEPFFIGGSTRDRVTYYHMVIFVMTLPLDRLYSELALISLCIHTLIHLRKEDARRLGIRAIFIPAVIYLLTLAGTLYTRFYGEAFYEWERQLAVLVFPLLVICNPFDFRKYSLNILFALSAGCFFTLAYLYFQAFDVIGRNHLPIASLFSNSFINHNFSAPLDMHATYFSMYIVLSAATMIYALLKATGSAWRMVYAIVLLVLLAGLIQLCSRAMLIAMAVIINVVIPFFLFRQKKRWYFMLLSGLLSVLVFFAVTRMDNIKTRFTVDLKEDLTQAGVNNNTLEPRITRWKLAWELIKTSPLYGHGSGSEIALLKQLYFRDKLYNSYVNDLNVHNQYLSMFIKTGIPGLLLLLLVFWKGYRLAFRRKDILFCSFLVIVSIASFSENILDANKGIFFFACFFSLFYRYEEMNR